MTGRYNALPLVLDNEALSGRGELLALLCGLTTWFVDGGHIYRRHALSIATEPEPKCGRVYRAHNCAIPPPTGEALRPVPAPISDSPDF